MRLPPAQNSNVASLGRLNISLPGKVYRAQAQAIQSFQGAMDSFGQLGIQIYEQNAAAEHSKLRADYMDRMNTAQQELERNPYREVLDDQGQPTGELISRHTEIINEFDEAEKRIHTDVISKSTNNLAFRKLTQDLDQGRLAYKARIGTTAANWAVEDNYRSFRESFRLNVANNRFEAADQDIAAATATGALSPGEGAKFAAEVMAKREYRVGEILIQDISAQNTTLEKVHKMHNQFDEGKEYQNMLPAQVAALHSKLNYRVQDMMAEDVATTIDTMSLADGEEAIKMYMARRWDKSGFSDERAYHSAIGHLWSVYNQRKERNAKTQQSIDIDARALDIENGGWASPKRNIDKKAMDLVFKRRIEDLSIQQGEPVKEGSNLWIRTAGIQARTQGWLPPSVEHFIYGNLLHMSPDSDVGGVLTAAKTVAYLDRHASRAIENMDKKDLATGLLINNAINSGVSDINAFMRIRDGIETIPLEQREYRTAAYDKEHSKNAGAVLEEKLKGIDKGWFDFGAPGFDNVMTAQYDEMVRQNFILTGHKEIAENMAFNEIMGVYGVSERSGNRVMEYKPPETVKRDAPPEKVREYVTDEWNQLTSELNLDPETHQAVYRLDNAAEDSWFIFNAETTQAVTDTDGNLLKWTLDYPQSRIGKIDALEAEQKRIQVELEVERQRVEAEAKWSRYETKPEDLRLTDRILRDKDRLLDTLEADLRYATGVIVETSEDIPDFLQGIWRSTRTPRNIAPREENKMYLRHERLKHELGAKPGSLLEQKIQRLQAIDEELEKLE